MLIVFMATWTLHLLAVTKLIEWNTKCINLEEELVSIASYLFTVVCSCYLKFLLLVSDKAVLSRIKHVETVEDKTSREIQFCLNLTYCRFTDKFFGKTHRPLENFNFKPKQTKALLRELGVAAFHRGSIAGGIALVVGRG